MMSTFYHNNVVEVSSKVSILNLKDIVGPPIMVHNVHKKQLFRKEMSFVTMDL